MFFKENKIKKCVISLGINYKSPKGYPPKIWQDFPRGIKRIRERLEELNFKGDFIGWDKDPPIDAPTFEEINVGIKPFCFLEAYKRGYELVLWLDASAYIKAPLEPLFKIIEKQGYLFVEAYHNVGTFCSDAALVSLGISREKSFLLKCCWSAIIGLDLRKERSRRFLFEWRDKAIDGVTSQGAKWSGVCGYPATVSNDPRVKGHRRQVVPSVLADRLGMTRWMKKGELDKYIEIERKYVCIFDENNGKLEE